MNFVFVCVQKIIWLQQVGYLQYTHSDAGKPFGPQYKIMDAKEERRKIDRGRYARMTNEEKQEKLRKRREAYLQKKTQEPEKEKQENLKKTP
jgi:hypothetical protein